MAAKTSKIHGGNAKSISEKYSYRAFESYTQEELILYLRKLTKDLKASEKTIASLKQEIEEQHKVIGRLETELAVFYDSFNNLDKYRGYDPNWLYIDKICFVLERSRKPLNSRQIVDLLQKIEPQLTQRLLDPYNSITKAIYNAIKLNRIAKHSKTGNFGYSYKVV